MKFKSDPGTHTYNQEHGIAIEKEKQEFLDDLKNGAKIITAYGIFGPEDPHGDAYVRVIKPDEGGTFLKVYGCSYPYKGNSPRELVYGMQMPKYLLSDFLRKIVGKSLILSTAIVFLFIQRKKFIRLATTYFKEVNHRIAWYYNYPEMKNTEIFFPYNPDAKRDNEGYIIQRIDEKHYNGFEKEILRAGRVAILGEGLWERACEEILKYAVLFLFLDNTYKLRVQDALGEGKDLFGTLDVLIERENKLGDAQSPKWKFIKRAMKLVLFTSPALKRIVTKFFDNLDRNKVQLDEADWYWALKIRSYNFRGYGQKWRYAERKRLDELNHTVFLI